MNCSHNKSCQNTRLPLPNRHLLNKNRTNKIQSYLNSSSSSSTSSSNGNNSNSNSSSSSNSYYYNSDDKNNGKILKNGKSEDESSTENESNKDDPMMEIDPEVGATYQIGKSTKELGKGAYGVVWGGVDVGTGEKVAVKKIFDAFRNTTDAQRTYREIIYLTKFGTHPNIISLARGHRAANNADFYLIFPRMETDLHKIIKVCPETLTPQFIQSIMYQLTNAISFMHSAQLLHRDLKPANVLIGKCGNVKLSDLGLSRILPSRGNFGGGDMSELKMTDYVATRWYRPLEILFSHRDYGKPMDIWGFGCIFGEMILKQPIFPGSDVKSQIELIVKTIDLPSWSEIEYMSQGGEKPEVISIEDLQLAIRTRTKNIRKIFEGELPEVLDLLLKMLQFQPNKRINIDNVLKHDYFKRYEKRDFEIEKCRADRHAILNPLAEYNAASIDTYRHLIYELLESGKIGTQFKSKRIYRPPKDSINNQRANQNASAYFSTNQQRAPSQKIIANQRAAHHFLKAQQKRTPEKYVDGQGGAGDFLANQRGAGEILVNQRAADNLLKNEQRRTPERYEDGQRGGGDFLANQRTAGEFLSNQKTAGDFLANQRADNLSSNQKAGKNSVLEEDANERFSSTPFTKNSQIENAIAQLRLGNKKLGGRNENFNHKNSDSITNSKNSNNKIETNSSTSSYKDDFSSCFKNDNLNFRPCTSLPMLKEDLIALRKAELKNEIVKKRQSKVVLKSIGGKNTDLNSIRTPQKDESENGPFMEFKDEEILKVEEKKKLFRFKISKIPLFKNSPFLPPLKTQLRLPVQNLNLFQNSENYNKNSASSSEKMSRKKFRDMDLGGGGEQVKKIEKFRGINVPKPKPKDGGRSKLNDKKRKENEEREKWILNTPSTKKRSFDNYSAQIGTVSSRELHGFLTTTYYSTGSSTF